MAEWFFLKNGLSKKNKDMKHRVEKNGEIE